MKEISKIIIYPAMILEKKAEDDFTVDYLNLENEIIMKRYQGTPLGEEFKESNFIFIYHTYGTKDKSAFHEIKFSTSPKEFTTKEYFKENFYKLWKRHKGPRDHLFKDFENSVLFPSS
jgi:hypothetical protein